jgi:hypothetical protein
MATPIKLTPIKRLKIISFLGDCNTRLILLPINAQADIEV